MSDAAGATSARTATGGGGPSWAVVAFAAAFPTVLTLAYFVVLAGQPRWLVQCVYGGGKIVQFAFPVLWVAWTAGRIPRPGRPRAAGAAAGLVFGVALLAGALALFGLGLAPAGLLGGAPAEAVRAKMASFGVDTVPRFVALATFYSVIHSAAEEYYWRWFLFGELRRACGAEWAVAGSSLAFAAHHAVILGAFLGWSSPWTPILAVGVGAGGAYWAWLYHRSGSLLGPWLGHLLADAAVFTIGYRLVF